MKIKTIFAFIVIGALLTGGCGYTTASLLPEHLKTIHVMDFKNEIDISREPSDDKNYRIYRPGLETEVGQTIIDEFLFDGRLKVVEEDEADLILTGELVDYYKQPLRYDRYDNVEEYRIIVTVNMELEDTVKGVTRWKVDGFVGFDTYRLMGTYATDESEASIGAITDLAKKTVEKIVEAW